MRVDPAPAMAIALAGLMAACSPATSGSTTAPTALPTPPAAPPASSPAAATPTMPTPAPPSTTLETVYVPRGETKIIEGLEVHAADILQKSDVDGHEVLRGTLRLRAAGAEEEIGFHVDSDGREPTPTRWNGYEIYVRGGSKAAIGVAVRRAR